LWSYYLNLNQIFFSHNFLSFHWFFNKKIKAVCDPPCVHGNCIAPNQCSCNLGWGGSNCSECANGYYPNNGNCVECNCNNHGTCSDGPNGNGSCSCDTGYATPPSSSNYCTVCSDGYVMQGSNCVQCYPTCQTCNFNSTYCTS